MEDLVVESNISKTLTEKTTKTIIIVILSMLFVLPFFEYSTFYTYTNPQTLGFNMLIDFSDALNNQTLGYADYISAYKYYIDVFKNDSYPLFDLSIPNQTEWITKNYTTFRSDEYSVSSDTNGDYAY